MADHDLNSTDFSSIRSGAEEIFDNDQAPKETPEVSPEAPQIAVESTSTPAAVVEELDPEVHGDRLVRVKNSSGEWETKPLKDVVSGNLRQSDYTRKTQELAAQRKEVEEIRAQNSKIQKDLEELSQLRSFLGDRKQVFAALKAQAPELFETAQQSTVGADASEIATIQQARTEAERLVNAQVKELQKQLAEQESRTLAREQAAVVRAETAKHAESINPVVKEIFEKNPILTAIPNAEDILRYQVTKMAPSTLQEAIDAFRTVSAGWVEDLNEKYTAANKTKLVQAAKLTTARIEPPGGSGLQIQPAKPAYDKKTNKTNWNAIRERSAALLDE